MKRTVSVCIALIMLLTGCSSKPTTQTPPPESEQVTSGVQQETQTPVVPEDNKQEQPEATPTPESTPSVEPTTEVADPTPEVTPEPEPTPSVEPVVTPETSVTPKPTPKPTPEPEVTPTPAPEQTTKPEPTPTPKPQPEPTPEPTPTPSTEPEVAEPTLEPEPTPTPDATIEINGGSTTEPKPPETPVPSQTQSTWVEGQKHTLADMKEGAIVVKADGTKVVLKRDPAYRNVLGAGQGVDIFTGLVDKDGHPVKLGGSVWGYDNGIHGKDLTVLKKCSITGEVHTEQEWNLISLATDPNGEYRGDYDGERFNTWWVWHAQGNFWYWSN